MAGTDCEDGWGVARVPAAVDKDGKRKWVAQALATAVNKVQSQRRGTAAVVE